MKIIKFICCLLISIFLFFCAFAWCSVAWDQLQDTPEEKKRILDEKNRQLDFMRRQDFLNQEIPIEFHELHNVDQEDQELIKKLLEKYKADLKKVTVKRRQIVCE